MARNTKREAERRVNLARPLTRFNLTGISYEFARVAIAEGKRVVVDFDGSGRSFELAEGTTNGYEIRKKAAGDKVVGIASFSAVKTVANASVSTMSHSGLVDYFELVAANSAENVVTLTLRGRETDLVLAKANDLDSIRPRL